jgi:NTE family protein
VQLLDATLADPLVEDVRTLMKVNAVLPHGAGAVSGAGRAFREIPFLFLGPRERGALAQEAQAAFDERYGAVRGALRRLTSPDLPLLAALLGGDGDRRVDVLSYVQSDRGFVDRAIALGQADAERALRSPTGAVPWRTTGLNDSAS